MLCPQCKVELKIAERQGIEIDYCSQCRGVWLDRGELDRIVERSLGEALPPRHIDPPAPEPERGPFREWDDDDADYHRHRGKRRRGWLADLFDFD